MNDSVKESPDDSKVFSLVRAKEDLKMVLTNKENLLWQSVIKLCSYTVLSMQNLELMRSCLLLVFS